MAGRFGLHLIMATQRPTGVITDSLKANTNLRIALRMADEADSVDVLDTPLAAHFDPSIPGRAAAKTGPGRVVVLQSAFPGAVTPPDPPAPPIDVEEFDFGQLSPWEVPTPPAAPADVPSDIDRLVATLQQAAEVAGVRPPRKPWLPALARVYNIERLRQRTDEEILLGVLDDPDNQQQVPDYFRPDVDGHIAFFGASGSGKTTALRSLATAASLTARSGKVHVYGLDFAGGGLSVLDKLPNVAPMIDGADVERVDRLLKHLESIIEARAVEFGPVADSLPDYRSRADRPDEPRLLLLVDGFTSFRDEFEHVVGLEAVFGRLQRILADGRAVGVHVAVSVDRPNGLPVAMAAAFQRRVILRQADDDAYRSLDVPPGILGASSPPGRCVQAHLHQELQLAILGDDPSLAAQAALIGELGAELQAFHDERPTEIRVLRDLVRAEEMPALVSGLPALGLEYATLEPVGFEPSGPLLLAGPGQSGRTNALLWMAHSLQRARPDVRLIRMSPRGSVLDDASVWADQATGPEETAALAMKLVDHLGDGPVAVFAESIADFLGTDAEFPLTELVNGCRRTAVTFAAESETSQWVYADLLNAFKNARAGLLLQPDQGDGDLLLKTTLPRTRRADFPSGRGYWVRAGRVIKVQVPWVADG